MTVKRAIFNLLIALAILTLPAQYFIDSSVENVACTCIALGSSLLVLFYLRDTSALTFHPLSGIAIFGFCLSTQLGALLVQSAAATALRQSLYDPLYTFGTLALYQVIGIAVHAAYRYFSVSEDRDMNLVRGVLEWAGFYRVPSCGALWYMGCVGLPTFLFWNYEGALGKVANAFSFLVWAPFLIPFYAREFGESYCNARLNRLLLVAYLGVIAILGLALNARGVMFIGIVTVALIYLLAGMRSNAPLTKGPVLKLGALAAVVIVIFNPMADLTTSMAIVRHDRGKISPSVMIRETIRVWRQPALIAAYRADQMTASRFSRYDEYYIANPMLARLVETKYYDNAFHFAKTLTTPRAQQRLRDVSIEFALAGLPTPILHALGIPIDKDDINYSMGDYLAYLSRGVPLGGRKTGNIFAQGIALFGPLFPFIYAAVCLILFGLMDLLTVKSAEGAPPISALGMLEIWTFFSSGITNESLHKVLHFVVRYFPQTLLIYAIVFASARLPQRTSRQAGLAMRPPTSLRVRSSG